MKTESDVNKKVMTAKNRSPDKEPGLFFRSRAITAITGSPAHAGFACDGVWVTAITRDHGD